MIRIDPSELPQFEDAVVHQAAPTRAASVVHTMMDGHRPAVWLSDRYSAQQGHGVAYALEASDDPVPFRLKLWLSSAFNLADAAAGLAAKQRALECRLDAILAAPSGCELTRA